MTPHQRAVELAKLIIDQDYLPISDYDPLAVLDDLMRCPPSAVPADGPLDDWTMEYLAGAIWRQADALAEA